MTLTIKLIRLGCPVALPFHFFSLTRGLRAHIPDAPCMIYVPPCALEIIQCRTICQHHGACGIGIVEWQMHGHVQKKIMKQTKLTYDKNAACICFGNLT